MLNNKIISGRTILFMMLMSVSWAILLSCNKNSLTPSQYVAFIQDKQNGLIAEANDKDYHFTLRYDPIDFVILNGLKGQSINSFLFDSLREQYSHLEYFTLKIGATQANIHDFLSEKFKDANYEDLMDYFRFSLQPDLHLIDETDTLPCVIYHFEQDGNLTPYLTFVLAFEKSDKIKEQSDLQVIYRAQNLNLGNEKFLIHKESLNNLPTLKL